MEKINNNHWFFPIFLLFQADLLLSITIISPLSFLVKQAGYVKENPSRPSKILEGYSMFKYLKHQWKRWGQRSGGFPLIVAAIAGVYFCYSLVAVAACGGGVMGCGLSSFSVVFPFYLLLTPVVLTLNPLEYSILYAFGALVYMAILYYFAYWLEQTYHRYRYRPKFILRKLQLGK